MPRNTLLFVSEKDDVGALSAVRVDVETGREHLTAKTMSAFQHIYEHHINDADWFLKVSLVFVKFRQRIVLSSLVFMNRFTFCSCKVRFFSKSSCD